MLAQDASVPVKYYVNPDAFASGNFFAGSKQGTVLTENSPLVVFFKAYLPFRRECQGPSKDVGARTYRGYPLWI